MSNPDDPTFDPYGPPTKLPNGLRHRRRGAAATADEPLDLDAAVEAAAQEGKAARQGGAQVITLPSRNDVTKAYQRKLADLQAEEMLERERAATGTRFGELLLNRTALGAIPPPKPLIANTLDCGTIALLAGPYGSYKSFVGLDWAASIATGQAWHGREIATPGPVVYVAGEGASGVDLRLRAWESDRSQAIADEDFYTLPVPVNLTRRAEVDQFIATIADLAPRLVIFDTLNRCAVGGDENSAKDMGHVIDAMERVKAVTADDGQGVVLVVHHTGKDGKIRGSSALPGGVNTIYQTSGGKGYTMLNRTKRKDGVEEDGLRLGFLPVLDSGVLTVSSHAVPRSRPQDPALELMTQAFSQGGASKSTIVSVLIEGGMTRTSAYRAVDAQLKVGALIDTGTPRRPWIELTADLDDGGSE